jgi:hypothetical protein
MTDRAPDIDLHKFFRDPDKARAIIDLCIADCVQNNIGLVRVVHGKGKGDFRTLVHSYLDKLPDVEGFTVCDPLNGGDGATWVHIRLKNNVESTNETDDDNPVKISASENGQIPDGVPKPFPPWIRRILLLILLAASFVVFPQWIARAGMVFLVVFMEFRFSQPDEEE